WMPAGSYGDAVVAAGSAGGVFFFEDGAGIHRVTSSGGPAPRVDESVLDADACTLGITFPLGAAESWIAYFSPCSDKRLRVYGVASKQTSDLGIDAKPGYLALMPAYPMPSGDPATDPFFVFYVADLDATNGLGTLVMRTPDHAEKKLGAS